MSYRISCLLILIALVGVCATTKEARAQAFGIELHNTLMPASGAMAGASIARPQDVQSALANPATLTQFRGTQFAFGGAWVEPTIRVDNDATLPIAGVDPYSAKSRRPGSALGNIAITQDLTACGLPMTFGLGLLTASGLGIDFRGIEESNGTSAELAALAIGPALGVRVTDRLSAGAALYFTPSTIDGPFSGISAAVPAYGLRGSLGVTYDVTECTTFGFHWWTSQRFQFNDAVLLPVGPFNPQDINLDFPDTYGFGIANNRLMDRRLLLAADFLLKRWSDAEFFGALWEDQFIFQLGAQYTADCGLRLRLGYAYAENITRDLAGLVVGGIVPPDALPGVQYIQAQFPAINEHRLTGGIGVKDALPGVDLDLFAGGMFNAQQAYGDTSASVASYWVGLGLTWRFGRGSCCPLPVPNDWN
jgi:long-chain fatty acid transport protein